MEEIVFAYLKKEKARLERKELCKIAENLREKQAELRPMQERYWDTLWANRRTEGDSGFVMVRP